MSPFEWGLLIVGLGLQCLVLSALLQGAVRAYPFVFAYVVVNLLSSIVQFSFKHYFGARSREFYQAYWVCDFLGTFLILMIIIHLVRIAMGRHRYGAMVYWGLLMGTVVVGVAGFLAIQARGFSMGRWLTYVGRDYYFSAVILNAMLWFALVRSSQDNKQIYLLTSGLGLQLTGAAVAHALRVSPQFRWHANVFLIATYLANLGVWYVALKRFPVVRLAGAADLDPSAREVEPTSL